MNDCDVLVLGGGPAGLAAASIAWERGHRTILLEASNVVGGNARTVEIDGFRFDTGAHRFHDKNPEATAWLRRTIDDELLTVDAPSAIIEGERTLRFPLRMQDLIRHLGPIEMAVAAGSLLRSRIGRSTTYPAASFAKAAVSSYGAVIAHRFLLNYTEKLWGIPTIELDAEATGGRIRSLGITTLIAELLGRRRASHMEGRFLYPELGFGRIWDSVVNKLPSDVVRRRCAVERLTFEGDKLQAVVTRDGEHFRGKTVISTLPLPRFAKMCADRLPAADVAEIQRLAFRTLRLVFLGIRRPPLTRFASLYFPDPRIPFTRLYESTNRSASMAPSGSTAIALELPCSPGDRWAEASESDLHHAAIQLLDSRFAVESRNVEVCETLTLPNAYPVLRIGADARIRPVIDRLIEIPNLLLLGRNQRFSYVHVHDLIAEALRIIPNSKVR